jgi:hypothetical protein
LPSRARCRCSPGIGGQAGVDGVADLALERAAGFGRCLAFGELALVVGVTPAFKFENVNTTFDLHWTGYCDFTRKQCRQSSAAWLEKGPTA